MNMQDNSLIEKQVQTSFESIQVDIAVTDTDLDNKEAFNKIVKKYQNRVSEMLKLIQKQKKQNQNLKLQFKLLNDQLNAAIGKIQSKPKIDDEQRSQQNKNEIVRRELENEVKKNAILRKQNEQFKYKYKYMEGDKVDGLKNDIKDRQRQIEDLQNQIRLFQKLQKQERQGDTYKKEEQLMHKILQQNEQIVHLKKKMNDMKKTEEALERTIKALREQVTTLEAKAQPKTALKQKQKQQIESPEEHQKLVQKYKQLQNIKKQCQKVSRLEIESLNSKIQSYEKQLMDLKQQVTKKQKENKIIMFKLKGSERKNYNTLEPIQSLTKGRYSEDILHSSLFEHRKQFRGLTHGLGNYRQFDDSTKLSIQKNYRIKKVAFTHYEEHILSLQTDYETFSNDVQQADLKEKDTTIKKVVSFQITSQYTNIKIVEYTFSEYEYITNVELYCSTRYIELIRIKTSKEQTIEVGNPKNILKCKLCTFEIKNYEKPISFLGILESKKAGSLGESKQFLINLGLQIKRKEVFLRSKYPKRIQSRYRQNSSHRSNNDKNVDEK